MTDDARHWKARAERAEAALGEIGDLRFLYDGAKLDLARAVAERDSLAELSAGLGRHIEELLRERDRLAEGLRLAREWLCTIQRHEEESENTRPRGTYDYEYAFSRIDRGQAAFTAWCQNEETK